MFSGDTKQLIPWTNYLINGTNSDGTLNFTSCVRLTPNMIYNWVQYGKTALNNGTTV